MQKYIPDSWKIVKITSKEHGEIYKVLASWQGGYTDADYWKLSSGFLDIKEEDGKYLTNQASGSFYILNKNYEKESSLIKERFNVFKSHLEKNSANIEYINAEDFYKFFNKL